MYIINRYYYQLNLPIMKTIYIFSILFIFILSSCSSQKFAIDEYDDLYYTVKKDKNQQELDADNTITSGLKTDNEIVVLNSYYRDNNTTQQNNSGIIYFEENNTVAKENELAGELDDQVIYSTDDDYDFSNIYSEENIYKLDEYGNDDDDKVSYSDAINRFNNNNTSNSYFSNSRYGGWGSILQVFNIALSFGSYTGYYSPFYSGYPYGYYPYYGSYGYSPYAYGYSPYYSGYSPYYTGYSPYYGGYSNYIYQTNINHKEENNRVYQHRNSTNRIINNGKRTRPYMVNNNEKSTNVADNKKNNFIRNSNRNSNNRSSGVHRTIKYNTGNTINTTNSSRKNTYRNSGFHNNNRSKYIHSQQSNSTKVRTNNFRKNSSTYQRTNNYKPSYNRSSSSSNSSSINRSSNTRSSNNSSTRSSGGRKR